MAESDVEVVRRAWEAFSRGDVDAASEAFDPEVRWHGADDDELDAGCHSRGQALAFIRQALADGVTAEALAIEDTGDRIVVVVQTHNPAEWRSQPGPHGEVVTVRDGKVVELVVYPTVDAALTAAE